MSVKVSCFICLGWQKCFVLHIIQVKVQNPILLSCTLPSTLRRKIFHPFVGSSSTSKTIGFPAAKEQHKSTRLLQWEPKGSKLTVKLNLILTKHCFSFFGHISICSLKMQHHHRGEEKHAHTKSHRSYKNWVPWIAHFQSTETKKANNNLH